MNTKQLLKAMDSNGIVWTVLNGRRRSCVIRSLKLDIHSITADLQDGSEMADGVDSSRLFETEAQLVESQINEKLEELNSLKLVLASIRKENGEVENCKAKKGNQNNVS